MERAAASNMASERSLLAAGLGLVDRFIDRPESLSLLELTGRRYWLAAWMFVPPLFLPTAALYAFVGATTQSVVLAAWLCCAPAIVLGGRRLSTAFLTHITAALHLALFVYMGLGSPPADIFAVAYMALVPLSVSLSLPAAPSFVWGLITAGCAGVVAVAYFTGFSVSARYAHQDELRWVMALLYVPACTAMGFLFLVQRRLVADEAAKSGRVQAAFLASMSHELRTPMNGVFGMTQLLLQTPLSAEQREHLQALRTSSEMMVSLLNDVLDFSKIESGKMGVEQIAFSPRMCATEAVALFQGAALAKGLQLDLTVEPSVPEAGLSDPTRLGQVLGNLISNAIKFTAQGSVRVKLTWAAGVLALDVTDTGIGIAPEALPQLFTPFHQVESSITRRFGGTGLGLAISARLVEFMGGHIRVSSTPNVGSTFTATIALPAVDPKTLASSREVEPFWGHSRRVLVVDDNPVNLAVARGLLTKLGFSVMTASTGAQAIEFARQHRYDLVLMDYHMPEMDGLTATRLLRASPDCPPMTIVALTASAMKEDADACLAAGMNDFLTKPLKNDQLIEVLRRHLT